MIKPGIIAMAAGATAVVIVTACASGGGSSPVQGTASAPQSQPQSQSGGQWASIPATAPPPHEYSGASQSCNRQQSNWGLNGPGYLNVYAEDDAAALQGAVANPYDLSQVTDNPNVSAIREAATKLLASSAKAEAHPFPSCADTKGFYPTAMHYYHQAAIEARVGSYGQANRLIRTGADAMAWLVSEPDVTSGFAGTPAGDY